MKPFCTLLLATLLSFAAITTSANSMEKEPVRHIVVFKYKSDAPEAEIQKITDAFRDLKDKIPGIISFEHGVNNSPEGLNRGLTHVYQLTFEDADARDAYLPHPEHQT